MTTIGQATLQIVPSLQGVSEAIEKQVAGKVVNVTIAPLVDAPAAEKAGKKTKEHVEKHTKEVKIEPKVDEAKAQEAGKKTGEAVAKGVSAADTAIGGFVVSILQGAGAEAGQRLGERLAQAIPTGMTGAAERIGTALRNSLPTAGNAAGMALGTAIGIALTDAIGKERLDKAGRAIYSGLTKAVNVANNATDIGVAIGNKVAGSLANAQGLITGAAGTITNVVGGIATGVDTAKQLLGGEDSWAAPGLNAINDALGETAPLLTAMNGAATLAAAGQEAITAATTIATTVQKGFNLALKDNPIGLIVTAIGLLVAGLVWFFTKTELGQQIWQKFTEYLKVAWEGIKIAFGAAWDVISSVWDSMVEGAKRVWDGVKEKFTAMVDFVKGLPGAIADAAKGLWDGLKNGFVAVLNWIGDKWNSLADTLSVKIPALGLDISLPKVPKIAFATGGYTGNGSAGMVAGVVHGGEYVIKATSTSGIENAYPGLLDYLNNKGALPGFQGGGKVQLGDISGPGITTGEQQSMWDVVRGKFPDAVLSSATRTEMTEGHPDFHNAGRAIDISGQSMGAIASWIASTYPDSLELIHSPFGHNIKNGKDVGDGTAFYGAGQMARHQNHIHWALGKTASMPSSSDIMPAIGVGNGTSAPVIGSSEAPTGTAKTNSESASSSMSVPGSLSGLAGMYGDQIGNLNPVVTPDGQTESLSKIGDAAGQLATGQVSSALSYFGVNDSPGWLKGLSTFVGGIKVGGASGGAAGGDVAPVASAINPGLAAAGDALGSVHGANAGQASGQQVIYNIQTTDIEPAYLASQRQEKERAAANLARY